MAVLTIRNLPDKVRDQLRQRAASAGLSMEAQARAILAKAGQESAAPEIGASLQAWVDDLYRSDRPRSAVSELLATRRREVRAERASARKPRTASKRRG
ncbi:MAG: FitA-like ribbon-helix-helix domain-containing protein [Rudaea sp.]